MCPALQFVQWTFAGAPGHPVLANTVYRIARILAERSVEDVSTQEVTGVTGPTVFTDAVYEYMRSQVGGWDCPVLVQMLLPRRTSSAPP
jgi:alpha 1,6-mannosyltransferase